MNPRVKGALLWGAVGLLTFLVLLQGYEIVQDIRVELPVKVGATVVVGVLSTVATYVASGRVETTASADGQQPDGQVPPDDKVPSDDPDPTGDAEPTDELTPADDGQPADGSASTDGAGRDDQRP